MHTEIRVVHRDADRPAFWRGVPSCVVLAVCLLSIGDPSQAETNLRFYQSFQVGPAATHACGAPDPVICQNVAQAEGKVGKGLRIGAGSKLAYATKSHINPGSGTILLWVKPAAAALKSGRPLSIVDCGNTDGKNNDVSLAYFPQFGSFGATFDVSPEVGEPKPAAE